MPAGFSIRYGTPNAGSPSRVAGVCRCPLPLPDKVHHHHALCPRCQVPLRNVYSKEVYNALNSRGGPIWERLLQKEDKRREPDAFSLSFSGSARTNRRPASAGGALGRTHREVTSRVPWALKVAVVGVRGLHCEAGKDKAPLRCVCEVEGKPSSRFETPVVDGAAEATWDHEADLANCEVGDTLVFSVQDKESGRTLGQASMRVGLGGFTGELPLISEGEVASAFIKLRITAGAG